MVYPRACGGTPNFKHSSSEAMGSIPARAGEPRYSDIVLGHERVYPRACGGTITSDPEFGINSGLSPRVRGNLINKLACDLAIGSIPARAGEPRFPRRKRRCGWVYPRACGGTTSTLPT